VHAQAPKPPTPAPIVDVSFLYVAEHTKVTYGSSVWLQGGSGELAFPLYKNLGLAMNVTGAHKSALTSGGPGVSKVSFVAGPRFTYPMRHARVFGEALFGGVHGFAGAFPGVTTVVSSANAFALQAGGGLDIDWNRQVSFRPIDASYVRTQLPNGGTNVQHDLRLAAGIVLRFPTR
jgi:hypothetical protein